VQQDRRKPLAAGHLTIVRTSADRQNDEGYRPEPATNGSGVRLELRPADLAALKRILKSVEDSKGGVGDPPSRQKDKIAAQIILKARQERASIFPPSMFSEPAWDMLLALFIAGEVPAAADLARLAGTPPTTAWRWVKYLEDHNLVERVSNAADRRTHTIRLTDQARTDLQRLFSEVARKWE
jgi:DNA-binding MarR family transcriptional regulator